MKQTPETERGRKWRTREITPKMKGGANYDETNGRTAPKKGSHTLQDGTRHTGHPYNNGDTTEPGSDGDRTRRRAPQERELPTAPCFKSFNVMWMEWER